MLSAEELEAEYYRRLKAQQLEQERLKFTNNDRDIDLENVWVAYVWTGDEWILGGFRRRRHRRKLQSMNRFFSKVRRKLGIDKKSPVMLYDLGTARRQSNALDQSWRVRPPQFQRRKVQMPQVEPKNVTPKRKGRRKRAPQKAIVFNAKTTKYIVLGRHSKMHRRKRGYLYLGPLKSEGKRQAQFEAKRVFPIYDDLLVVAVNELSKPLRGALKRNRRARAGVTRLEWPEVPPAFDKMWDKFVKRLVRTEFAGLEVDDPALLDTRDELRTMWEEQKQPWLTMNWFRKQITSWSAPCAPKQAKKSVKRARRVIKKTTKPSRAPQRKQVKVVARRLKTVRCVATKYEVIRARLPRAS